MAAAVALAQPQGLPYCDRRNGLGGAYGFGSPRVQGSPQREPALATTENSLESQRLLEAQGRFPFFLERGLERPDPSSAAGGRPVSPGERYHHLEGARPTASSLRVYQ